MNSILPVCGTQLFAGFFSYERNKKSRKCIVRVAEPTASVLEKRRAKKHGGVYF